MTSLQQQARALGDPTRHAIFRYILDSEAHVGVAELTREFALNHNAIRQHLAKLVAAELLVETTVPHEGRGRPALAFRLHPRSYGRWGSETPYERLSRMLVDMVRTNDSAQDVGRRAGRAYKASRPGTDDSLMALAEAMTRFGFDPSVRRRVARSDIVLHTCPFESAVLADQETVCSLHLGLAEGIAEGGDAAVIALDVKDPRRAGCKLKLRHHTARSG